MRKWSDIVEDLAELLDVSRVKTRKIQSTVIPYLEGEDAIRTANRIFGFDGWSGYPTGPVERFEVDASKNRYTYTVPYTCEFHGLTEEGELHTIVHGDIGKNSVGSDSTNQHEMAVSGCATDALKRAMRHLGDQFGLALYDKESDTFKQATGVMKKKTTTRKKKATASQKPQEAQGEAQAEGTTEDTNLSPEDRAKAYKVPDKLPMGGVTTRPPLAGETLGSVLTDSIGEKIMGWLAGVLPTPPGHPPLEPANKEQERLQAAAKFLWDMHFAGNETEAEVEEEVEEETEG